MIAGFLTAMLAVSSVVYQSGYHQIEGRVYRLSSGSYVQTKEGKYYWPRSSQYEGCQIRLRGKVFLPSEAQNPGGFDQRKWLYRHGIQSMIIPDEIQVLSCQQSVSKWIRDSIHQRLSSLKLKHPQEIEAILISQSAKKDYYWYAFGVIHFLSISGMHINGIFYLITTFFRNTTIGFIGIVLYGYVIQFPLPSTRAILFLSLRRVYDLEIAYWLSLSFLLSLDPLMVFDIGAWFSFVASYFLLFFREDSIYLTLGLLWVSCLFSLDMNLLSWIANYILTPIFYYWVFPLAFVGIFFKKAWIGCDMLLSSALDFLKILQGFHYAIELKSHHLISLPIFGLLRYFFSLPRVLILLLAFPMPSNQVEHGTIKLSLLSVGHGLSIIISTKNHHLLYDIGSQDIDDVTHAVLFPFLSQENIRKFDAVVISHADYDHYSGLFDLMRDKSIGTLWVSTPLVKERQKLCQKGIYWDWDGVRFEFVHPDQALVWRGNNNSCVLKITTKENRVLLTGDIEIPAQRHLMKVANDQIKADVLLLPHHGSQRTTDPSFIEAVSPSIQIVSSRKQKPQHKSVLRGFFQRQF